MRIYIISSDGITLCREPPAPVSEGEIVVASNEELPKSPMAARSGWSSQDGETLGGAALRHAALPRSRCTSAVVRCHPTQRSSWRNGRCPKARYLATDSPLEERVSSEPVSAPAAPW